MTHTDIQLTVAAGADSKETGKPDDEAGGRPAYPPEGSSPGYIHGARVRQSVSECRVVSTNNEMNEGNTSTA